MWADDKHCWRVIEQQRVAIADLLSGLTEAEWEAPSLCAHWRIRDVAAHLVLGSRPLALGPAARAFVLAGGRYNAMVDRLTVAYADRPGADLAAELRAAAPARTMPAVTNVRNLLFDTIVHGQDIALPLNRSIAVRPGDAAAAASRVWGMGWPFRARRRLRDFELIADDIDWSVGSGTPIHGPALALLLLMTGRPIALRELSGDGIDHLRRRLAPA
ncbi:maleylpyruvate isomerase family mycothiol-dependent enzyme [Nocardia veterana]|uniref:Maleylpyruvate isomerase family mycothiol-dependent enzyme n=2 Tax=Nocardia veterana TaxID=132249 RepID=A0A7X6M2B1_9NOCA|nr:maleylpyruvate isomerase family mycothiol-dependent enzyme [Nocardia veterana]